jgi:hypothetical protein
VRGNSKTKAWIRWLALCGVLNVMFLAYNLVLIALTLHQSEWPVDIQKRSYFTQEMCGAKTDRACPGPQVPIARPGSAYLTPEGNVSHVPGNWSGPPHPQVPFMK